MVITKIIHIHTMSSGCAQSAMENGIELMMEVRMDNRVEAIRENLDRLNTFHFEVIPPSGIRYRVFVRESVDDLIDAYDEQRARAERLRDVLEQTRIALETDQQYREWVLKPSPRPFNSEEYWEDFPDVGQKGADERRKQALDAIAALTAAADDKNPHVDAENEV